MTRKILIVEDEEDIAKLLVALFNDLVNYETHRVKDGEEAILFTRTNNPDIIILDVHLPDITGYEVCKIIKSDPAISRTKVIMLSGMTQYSDKLKAWKVGADDYVDKPFSTSELITKVELLLTEYSDPVVLVDKYGNNLFTQDSRLSIMEKIQAHSLGVLHRATSIYIFNSKDELLIQKRAASKYHSPNKWANTCCTHPLPGETPFITAQRRLREEMGLVVALTEVFRYSYQADVGIGLTENEFNHVFFGVSDQDPEPNPAEVSDWMWVNIEKLKKELFRNPENFCPWLKICFNEVTNHWYRKLESSCIYYL